MIAKPSGDFDRVDDLLQAYFDALRVYNKTLGAFEMTASQLRDAMQGEALNYARVRKLKAQLAARGVSV